MGAADLVPGISGGTIAFITGIYEEFLSSLNSINSQAFKALVSLRFPTLFKIVRWPFLVTLALGILSSFVFLSRLIHGLLESPLSRTNLFAAFLGLVLGSLIFIYRQLKKIGPIEVAAFVIACAAAFLFTQLDVDSKGDGPLYDVYYPATKLSQTSLAANYNAENQMITGVTQAQLGAMVAKGLISASDPIYSTQHRRYGVVEEFLIEQSHWLVDGWLLFCGVFASGAMLLPGISGSYLLTILGAYEEIIGALADLARGLLQFHLPLDSLFLLMNLGIGIGIGLLFFSRLFGWMLARHHNPMIATLVGLMLGSLPAVWPFWESVYVLDPLKAESGLKLKMIEPILPDPLSNVTWIALLYLLGAMGALYLLESFAQRRALSSKSSRGQEL